MRYLIGLDIGGTKCAVCVAHHDVDQRITIMYRNQIPTVGAWQVIVNKLLEDAMGYCKEHDISPLVVGISCGGPLSINRRAILSPPNLVGWDNVPIIDYIHEKTGLDAYMENDADACALAEWKYGAGKRCDNMVFLTCGTGIGAGLIIDRKLHRGYTGMAGEVGHIRMTEDGPIGYGKKGSLEGFASGGGIKQLAGGGSAKEVISVARAGDKRCLEIVHTSAMYLGRGLAILIDILNPERIILGGIYARAEDLYKNIVKETIKKEALYVPACCTDIVAAGLGESIGDYGALCAGIYNATDIFSRRFW